MDQEGGKDIHFSSIQEFGSKGRNKNPYHLPTFLPQHLEAATFYKNASPRLVRRPRHFLVGGNYLFPKFFNACPVLCHPRIVVCLFRSPSLCFVKSIQRCTFCARAWPRLNKVFLLKGVPRAKIYSFNVISNIQC